MFDGTFPCAEPLGRDEPHGSSRYELLMRIGDGESSSIYIGRTIGNAGFSRLVAVKRPRKDATNNAIVQKMMATEARLASQLHHSNLVAVQDVDQVGQDLLLVLDYVEGASLADLLELGVTTGRAMPAPVALRIALDACAGLTAVHEFEGADGTSAGRVGLLHRNLAPQNILVGVDGTARLTDFGLAKHQSGALTSVSCTLQGKIAYQAPEVLDDGAFSVQSDLFALVVVVWESLAGQRLFRGTSWADTVRKIGRMQPPALSSAVPELGDGFDAVFARALDKVPSRRHATVRDFEEALEQAAGAQRLIATTSEVSRYVKSLVGEMLQRRRELLRAAAGSASATTPPLPRTPAAEKRALVDLTADTMEDDETSPYVTLRVAQLLGGALPARAAAAAPAASVAESEPSEPDTAPWRIALPELPGSITLTEPQWSDETGTLSGMHPLGLLLGAAAGAEPLATPLDKTLHLYERSKTPRIYYPIEVPQDGLTEDELPSLAAPTDEEPLAASGFEVDEKTVQMGAYLAPRAVVPGQSMGYRAPTAVAAGVLVGASAAAPASPPRRVPRSSAAAKARKIAGMTAFGAAVAAVVLLALVLCAPAPQRAPTRNDLRGSGGERTSLQAR